jgi:PII-like signaling protein
VVDGLKLSVYFGERDRAGRLTSAEAIARAAVAAGARTAVLVRAVEGFGSRGAVQTERMLTLSEDLPLVWTVTDRHDRIAPLAGDVADLIPQGVVTLERCGILDPGDPGPASGSGELKLTVTVGRGRRSGGTLAYAQIVDHLQACGVDGAYVLVGVDGLLHGVRHRARLVGTNAAVPAQITAIGAAGAIARAVAGLADRAIPALITRERVRILKRDGVTLGPLPDAPPARTDAPVPRQVLTVITREDARAGDGALHVAVLRAARDAGALGATTLAGVWGYSGRTPPHGDSMRRMRRSVPVVCTIIDTPERIARVWPAIDALTGHGGLVTTEFVPAMRAHGPVGAHGRLGLRAPTSDDPGVAPG